MATTDLERAILNMSIAIARDTEDWGWLKEQRSLILQAVTYEQSDPQPLQTEADSDRM